VGRIANFCIMLAAFQVDLFILGSGNTGEFRPFLLIPVSFRMAAFIRWTVHPALAVYPRIDSCLSTSVFGAVTKTLVPHVFTTIE